MTDAAPRDWPISIPLLWAEFVALFGVAPVMIAVFIGVVSPIMLLLGLVVVALGLLHRTPDFRMAELLQGPVLGEWRLILGFAALCAVGMSVIAVVLIPGRFLEIFRYRPELWLMIMALYPLFSALPQEIIFRTLFFRRYGRLFASRHAALMANAVAFGLAHLFFQNPVAVVLTAVGGWIFGWAYLRHHSTLLTVVLHSIAGQAIFTAGLGVYFYHGAIPA